MGKEGKGHKKPHRLVWLRCRKSRWDSFVYVALFFNKRCALLMLFSKHWADSVSVVAAA